MPASKYSHVLALLRDALALKQTELAKMADCSVATVQSVELGRLKLSNALAARIGAATGVDLDWLRANDLNQPVPPIRALTVQNEVIDHFRELFDFTRTHVRGSERETLILYIAWELNRLKSAPALPELTPEEERRFEELDRKLATIPDLTPEEERQQEELDRKWEEEQAAKATRKSQKKKLPAPVSEKALTLKAPKARHRSRQSA